MTPEFSYKNFSKACECENFPNSTSALKNLSFAIVILPDFSMEKGFRVDQLPESAISSWFYDGSLSHPGHIGWMCPFCHRSVSFSTPNWHAIGQYNWHATARCPLCPTEVQFFTMQVGTGHQSLAGGSLYIHPSPKTRSASPAILESNRLAPALKRAYQSSVNVINVQEWSAAAVMCRRLLEGIIKTSLPTNLQSGPLAKQLAALPEHVDLGKPLLDLAGVVRKAGNLGAHFSLEQEPDEEVAILMLELCEDLIDYLFVLPERIDELKTNLQRLENSDPSEQAT